MISRRPSGIKYLYSRHLVFPKTTGRTEDNITISLLQSRHRLLHRPMHDDGFQGYNHIRQQRCEAGGLANRGTCDERHKGYRRTHSRDSPSDIHGTRPSGNLHQRVCHKGQTFNQWFYLCPDLWEHWCLLRVFATKPMNLAAPVVIIIWLGLDERVERIYYLTVAYDHHTYRTN